METKFLEYYKTILNKVSFDNELMKKEYSKALKSMSPFEQQQFLQWVEQEGLIERIGQV